MNSRLIFYISGILIYAVFRSFYPTPAYDKIEIQNDTTFLFKGTPYSIEELDVVIREFRKTIPPDQKPVKIIELTIKNRNIKMGIYQDVKTALRKNGFLLIIFRDKPFWQFWK